MSTEGALDTTDRRLRFLPLLRFFRLEFECGGGVLYRVPFFFRCLLQHTKGPTSNHRLYLHTLWEGCAYAWDYTYIL